jgi:hypothetical protein
VTDQERLAHDLVARLADAGVQGTATGGGVHWRVDLATAGRSMRVHCFWYGDVSGLVLGMNAANARASAHERPSARTGPEYAVTVRDGAMSADGRTHDVAQVLTCAKEWLGGCSPVRLAMTVPFIDRLGRAMRAIAERIDPRLGWELGGDPSYALWVHRDGRSCELKLTGDALDCVFRVGQASVAFASFVDDPAGATSAWLLDRISVTEVPARIDGAALERHAEVLEADPARWHWLHMRDRIADPDDVLADLRPLHERLAASPVATRFFSYSSLNRLCFSASSHYPWVDPGLPAIAPAEDDRYALGRDVLNLEAAVALIESTLSAFPIPPFFGSAYHLEHRVLAARLKTLGSPLEPLLAPRGAWFDVVVPAVTSARRCRVSPRDDWTGRRNERTELTLIEGASSVSATWPSWDDAIVALRRFCEADAPLEELLRAPGVDVLSRST